MDLATGSQVALPGRMQEERKLFLNGYKFEAPSSLAAPSKFSKNQQTKDQKIIWSRPPAADAAIPVVLYNSILRNFVDDCANHELVYEDNKLALELTDGMSQFFDTEDRRAETLRQILKDNGILVSTPTITHPGQSKTYRTDAAIDSGNGLVSIIEIKGEIGSTGADPYAQAILYYTNFGRATAENHLTFNSPCLIVTVFGLILLSSLAVKY
jgi:hypothetical protein